MDKASLLGDAIAYINKLQSKLQEANLEIEDLQSRSNASCDKPQESGARAPTSPSSSHQKPQGNGSTAMLGKSSGDHKFTISVHIFGEEAIIRVTCSRDSYSVANTMMALQGLRLDIRHSSTSTTRDTILHIVVAKVMQKHPGCS